MKAHRIAMGIFIVLATIRVFKAIEFFLTIRNHISARSKIDGRSYYVVARKGYEEAADLLASIRSSLEALLSELEKRSLSGGVPESSRDCVRRLLYLFPKGRGIHLYEIDSRVEKSIAFTRNKVDGFYICLRNEQNYFHPKDQVLFLAIHELTHAGIRTFDPEVLGKTVHSKGFRTCEAYLYDVAKETGILDSAGIPGRPHCGAYLVAPSA